MTLAMRNLMRARTIVLAACVAAFACAMSALPGSAESSHGNDSPGIAPANSTAFGKSLEDWMQTYWVWAYTNTPASGMVEKVLMLPMPSDAEPAGVGAPDDPLILTGHADVTIKPGTSFVLPLVAWMGEIYLDGSVDAAFPPDWVGEYYGADATLDGRAIVQDNLEYYVGPTAFDQPLWYDAPTDYGSIGAVYFQGVGIVCKPLPAGTHTLTNRAWFAVPEDNEAGLAPIYLEFHNTWTITVAP